MLAADLHRVFKSPNSFLLPMINCILQWSVTVTVYVDHNTNFTTSGHSNSVIVSGYSKGLAEQTILYNSAACREKGPGSAPD